MKIFWAMAATKPFFNRAVLACLSGLLLCRTSGLSAESRFLSGHVPSAVTKLQPIGRLAATTHLELAIGLPLRDAPGLTNFLRDLYNPANPSYRHFLTSQEFTDKFGPTEEDYQGLIAFAKAKGFTVTGTHPNRLVLDVNASVGDLERAFQIKLQIYQHPKEGRTFYAPDSEPAVESAIRVLDIAGLDN